MVAPAFGFSVGDFVATIQLIGTATKALRQTKGASKQYQQAILELELLEDTLKKVQRLGPSAQNATTIQKIQLCASACHTPLAEFIATIEKFGRHLDPDRNAVRSFAKHVTRSGRKIQWAVAVEEDLARLKASIAPYLSMINILLQVERLEETSRLHETAQKDVDVGQTTLLLVRDLESTVAKDVATRSQVAALLPAIEGLFAQQMQEKEEAFLAIQSSADAVQRRLSAQDSLIQGLLSRASTPTEDMLSNTDISTQQLHTTAAVSFAATKANNDNRLSLQIGNALHALHEGISGLLLFFLCLLPAFQRLCRMLTAMPRSPTLLLEDNIRLEDALGRVLSLPYEHFRFWPILHARLQCDFKDRPGERKVAQNQFHVINLASGGNRVLTRKSWETSIVPGAQLAMSMLFQDWKVASKVCPGCGAVDDSAGALKWVRW